MKKGMVSVRHMQGLIERGNRAGVDYGALLEDVGCHWKASSQCNLHLTSEIYAKVALRLMEIVEDEFILLGGMPRTRPGTFAMMTHSVIDSADLRKAILRCGQFYQLFVDDLHFSMCEHAGSVRYFIRFDNPSLDWEHTTTESVLVAFHRFFCWLIGQPIMLDGVEPTCAPPADGREYWHLFGCPVKCNAPSNNLVFSSRYLHFPIRQTPASLNHSYKLEEKGLKYAKIIQQGRINPMLTRYELHRVWVVDAKLKSGRRHIYSRRTLYVDENTWQAGIIDHYDGRNNLWRLAEAHEIQYYNYDVPLYAVSVIYDMLSGRYVITGMENEEAFGVDLGKRFPRKEFSPNELRNSGVL